MLDSQCGIVVRALDEVLADSGSTSHSPTKLTGATSGHLLSFCLIYFTGLVSWGQNGGGNNDMGSFCEFPLGRKVGHKQLDKSVNSNSLGLCTYWLIGKEPLGDCPSWSQLNCMKKRTISRVQCNVICPRNLEFWPLFAIISLTPPPIPLLRFAILGL